jgi:hypothetical protein
VAALRIGMRRQTAAVRPASFFTSIRDGLSWLNRDRRLIGVFVITIIFNVFGWPATSMVPVIGTDYLGLGPKGVGLLASCDGVGGLLGALLMTIAPTRVRAHRERSGPLSQMVVFCLRAGRPGGRVRTPGGLFNAGRRQQATRLSRRAGRDARACSAWFQCIGTG